MVTYRIPLEFEANDDNDARAFAEVLDNYVRDNPGRVYIRIVRVILDEMARSRTYWEKVGQSS